MFKDKVAIVTGGASGIGKELGKKLAGAGARVVLADINTEALDEVVQGIKKTGASASAARLDVTDREGVRKLVEDIVAEQGRLDYMFNNVGIGVAGEVRDYELKDWADVVDVNIYGVVNGVDAAYPVMLEQGFGHIVNTSSIAGLIPFPMETSYSAVKHAIVGLSLSLRVEAADLGVKVSVVCPGIINTPIWHTSRIVNLDREKALAAMPFKMASVRRCAREILKGVEKNKPVIVITNRAKTLWLMQRFFPGLLYWVQKRQMKLLRKARIEK